MPCGSVSLSYVMNQEMVEYETVVGVEVELHSKPLLSINEVGAYIRLYLLITEGLRPWHSTFFICSCTSTVIFPKLCSPTHEKFSSLLKTFLFKGESL